MPTYYECPECSQELKPGTESDGERLACSLCGNLVLPLGTVEQERETPATNRTALILSLVFMVIGTAAFMVPCIGGVPGLVLSKSENETAIIACLVTSTISFCIALTIYLQAHIRAHLTMLAGRKDNTAIKELVCGAVGDPLPRRGYLAALKRTLHEDSRFQIRIIRTFVTDTVATLVVNRTLEMLGPHGIELVTGAMQYQQQEARHRAVAILQEFDWKPSFAAKSERIASLEAEVKAGAERKTFELERDRLARLKGPPIAVPYCSFFGTDFLVHPTEACAGLKSGGHAGSDWSYVNNFNRKETACLPNNGCTRSFVSRATG